MQDFAQFSVTLLSECVLQLQHEGGNAQSSYESFEIFNRSLNILFEFLILRNHARFIQTDNFGTKI
jgi:hypothetical protein